MARLGKKGMRQGWSESRVVEGGVSQSHYLCGGVPNLRGRSLSQLLPSPPPQQPGTVSSTHTHQLTHHSWHCGHPLSKLWKWEKKESHYLVTSGRLTLWSYMSTLCQWRNMSSTTANEWESPTKKLGWWWGVITSTHMPFMTCVEHLMTWVSCRQA